MFTLTRLLILLLLSLAMTVPRAFADERLKGIACRSVHLGYAAGEGAAFYNEAAVDQSAAGTFFMVCGWSRGYFGLQELGDGKKLLLFSVWDSGRNDPKAVAEEKRVKVLHKDEKTRVGRFGGEGTGGQAFFDYHWKAGQTYRFLVTAKPDKQRTEYAGYFFVPEDKSWKHLVTFSTITGGKYLSGYYSFVEDFKRDRTSTTKVRKAHFGNGWVRTAEGKWTPLREARFTADSNPVTNIDAGTDGKRFFLATGGGTENKGARLGAMVRVRGPEKLSPPTGLPAIERRKRKSVCLLAEAENRNAPSLFRANRGASLPSRGASLPNRGASLPSARWQG